MEGCGRVAVFGGWEGLGHGGEGIYGCVVWTAGADAIALKPAVGGSGILKLNSI